MSKGVARMKKMINERALNMIKTDGGIIIMQTAYKTMIFVNYNPISEKFRVCLKDDKQVETEHVEYTYNDFLGHYDLLLLNCSYYFYTKHSDMADGDYGGFLRSLLSLLPVKTDG